MSTDSLEIIADALLRSYDLDREERPRLPDRKAVVDTLDHIRRILFPGYYAEERLPLASRRHHVCTWLCRLEDQLTSLIGRCFAHDTDRSVKKCHRKVYLRKKVLLESAFSQKKCPCKVCKHGSQ